MNDAIKHDKSRANDVFASLSSDGSRLKSLESRVDNIESRQSSILAPLLASSIPSSVAILGFGIFHFLALRRQKRSEIFELFGDIKSIADDIQVVASSAWRDAGQTAIQSGKVSEVRHKTTRCREEIRLLVAMEPKPAATAFRSSLNEAFNKLT